MNVINSPRINQTDMKQTEINQSEMNYSNNRKKSHYFIGHKINFEPELLNAIQQYTSNLQQNKNIRTKHSSPGLHTRFIYLGYLDNNTAQDLIENKLKPLLEYIVSKLNKLNLNTECLIEPKVQIDGHKRTYQKVQIVYSNKMIEEKIVPILRKITEPIYGEYEFTFTPHINIMSIEPVKSKNKELYENKMKYYGIELPHSFNLSSIDILKSTTLESRVGRASKNDASNIEVISTFELNNSNTLINTPEDQKSVINKIRDFLQG